MSHPYDSLPPDAFWRTAVADRSAFDIKGLWRPKWAIGRKEPIVTTGSCFAQHFGRALAARGYAWLDAQPGPRGLGDSQRRDFHYGTFSFRTGNIYTPRMLRQWLDWAFADGMPDEVWQKAGRFFDPFRPGIEPDGFVTLDELRASQAETLAAIRAAVTQASVFVFTLGLTESWQGPEGVEYAICPGTVAGRFDPAQHRFLNHGFAGLMADMEGALSTLFQHNPGVRVLLTVSPVPLTATASGAHVLVATSQSKALLRAVAGALADDPRIDYFPSYEIITAPPFRGMFFAPNQRSIAEAGVAFVMEQFFSVLARAPAAPRAPAPELKPAEPPAAEPDSATDLRCEEEILNAFAQPR